MPEAAARRALSDLELRHLRLLAYVRERARINAVAFDTQFEDFVLELREKGYTARGLADILNVAFSTVQLWTKHARDRRRQP